MSVPNVKMGFNDKYKLDLISKTCKGFLQVATVNTPIMAKLSTQRNA